MQLGLVGKDEIDGAPAHQFEKLVPVTIDAEQSITSAQPVAGAMRETRSLDEGLLGVGGIPQITFEIDDVEAAICASSISAGVRLCAAPR
jgi:hypothetical protein